MLRSIPRLSAFCRVSRLPCVLALPSVRSDLARREDISMDYATADLALAILHHLLVFMLAGILAFEIGTVSLTMKRNEILRVVRVDMWYGILAGVIIVVGFIRATVAAKGWAYYEVNAFFWAKIATFLVIGLLSIVPTVAMIRWRNALKSDAP